MHSSKSPKPVSKKLPLQMKVKINKYINKQKKNQAQLGTSSLLAKCLVQSCSLGTGGLRTVSIIICRSDTPAGVQASLYYQCSAMTNNFLLLNSDKTEVLLTGTNFCAKLEYCPTLDSFSVKFSSSFKDLGVIVDSSLSFEGHFSSN